MDAKTIKDLMVSLDEYAVVPEDATVLEALNALESAQENLPPGREPHRAVLVVDKRKKVVGKIGQLAFLRALEPKYLHLGDLKTLARAGLSEDFVDEMMENLSFLRGSLEDICRQAGSLRARDVMHPVSESIDENAPLAEAIHKIVLWQTLSILVTRRGEVVGILRLSDLFTAVSARIKGKPA
jgi:CBS domain-containing protein